MDSRKHPRFPVRFRSSFSSINLVSGTGILGDLSICGCRVASGTAVQPGTEVELRLEMPNKETPIVINRAVVRWCRDGEFGLEFVGIAEHEWTRLQRLVAEVQKEPFQREQESDNRGSDG
jgi:hypothetical protein